MPRPPLILHVGIHRTGTTAIQTSLAANRAWLRDRGVQYPELEPDMGGPQYAHHAVAHALADPSFCPPEALVRFQQRIETGASRTDLTVISAEPFYRHRLGPGPRDTEAFLGAHRAYLRRVAEYFEGFSPTILLYLRRPDAVLVSRYKGRVASGAQMPRFGDFAAQRPWLVAFAERLALFREVFGAVETRVYETECDGGLVPRFYAGLGLSDPPGSQAGTPHVSPSDRATLWLWRAQREAPRRRSLHHLRVLYAASPEGAALFKDPGPTTLWPSTDAFDAFVSRHRSAYEAGGFEIPDPAGVPRAEWSNPMHAEAERAFARWERARTAETGTPDIP